MHPVLPAPAYVGQLGPTERTERLLEQSDGGAAASRGELRYAAGLDLGGDTPQSVALAIVSEITAAFGAVSAHTGGKRCPSIWNRLRSWRWYLPRG
ncbi:XdhC family protein [Pseudomonas versuta]|uniref:XdhC family protein n=1 Tax=Pseudomonas versuta TaxID=1788301 RepID=UPI0009374C9F|nr:XdhC family protein [Pseudomonas versuta]